MMAKQNIVYKLFKIQTINKPSNNNSTLYNSIYILQIISVNLNTRVRIIF